MNTAIRISEPIAYVLGPSGEEVGFDRAFCKVYRAAGISKNLIEVFSPETADLIADRVMDIFGYGQATGEV